MLTAFGGSAVPAVPRDVGLTRLQPRVPPEPSEGQPWPGSGVPAPPAGRSDGLIFPSGPSPAADAGGGGFAVAAAPAPAFPCCCRAPTALPSAPSRCLSHLRHGWSGVTVPWQGWDGVLGGNGHPLQFGLLWAFFHSQGRFWGVPAALGVPSGVAETPRVPCALSHPETPRCCCGGCRAGGCSGVPPQHFGHRRGPRECPQRCGGDPRLPQGWLLPVKGCAGPRGVTAGPCEQSGSSHLRGLGGPRREVQAAGPGPGPPRARAVLQQRGGGGQHLPRPHLRHGGHHLQREGPGGPQGTRLGQQGTLVGQQGGVVGCQGTPRTVVGREGNTGE